MRRRIHYKMRNEAVEHQQTERFFHEVQGEQPSCAKNFFDYWNDYNPMAQEDYYFKIDDWG